MTDYKELRRLAEAATPGPWSACGHQRGGCVCGHVWSTAVDFPVATAFRQDELIGKAPEGRPQANALYIAAASPSVVLALLEEIEGLRHKVQVLTDIRDGIVESLNKRAGPAMSPQEKEEGK